MQPPAPAHTRGPVLVLLSLLLILQTTTAQKVVGTCVCT